MKRQNTFIAALAVTAAVVAAFCLLQVAPAYTGNEINMTPPVAFQSAIYHQLHMVVLSICIVIGVIVFSAMFVSIVLHRKSKNYGPAQFEHSIKAEIFWATIPILILVVIALPATKALVNREIAPETEMTVKMTGYPWRWKYDYLEDGIQLISSLDTNANAARQLSSDSGALSGGNYLREVDQPLVLPTDTRIKFLITVDNVNQSWWLPSLGRKRSTIPGFINEAWTEIKEPGTYRGECAQLCGKDHGFMPIVLNVLPKAEYLQWVKQQKARQDFAQVDIESLQRNRRYPR